MGTWTTILGQEILNLTSDNSLCLNRSQLMLYTRQGNGRVNLQLMYVKYVYPIQFVIGIVGNILNLIVLMGKGNRCTLRSTTNSVLACLTMFDLSYLLVLLPSSLATIEALALNHYFYVAYRITYYDLVAMANWFHAASTWTIVTLTLVRFSVVIKPLACRAFWTKQKLAYIMCLIFIISFTLTFYDHFANMAKFYWLCNGTQLVSKQRHMENWEKQWGIRPSEWMLTYIKVSTTVKNVVVHVIPLITLLTFNIIMLICLKRHNTNMGKEADDRKHSSRSDTSERNEKKVTVMVLAIVITFTVCNAPAMSVTTLKLCFGMDKFNKYAVFSNGLEVMGVVLNFFMYCLSSGQFRKRALALSGLSGSRRRHS